MASSNRHWPSLFKSKPHHQWQHDINSPSLLPSACQKPPYTSAGAASEERTPEPKPRWNPKPEQIRILEAIFNSGMVNPPRDEIRRIRIQLQEYGQVGDANVFYWFQNRKSRSKHKQRQQLQSSTRHQSRSNSSSATTPTATSSSAASTGMSAATSSSSSSSDPSTPGSDHKTLTTPSKTSVSNAASKVFDLSASSPTASVNQTYFHHPPADHHGFSGVESFLFQGPQGGYCLPTADLSSLVGAGTAVEQGLGLRPGLWSELMSQDGCNKSTLGDYEGNAKMQLQAMYGSGGTTTTTPATVTVTPSSATTTATSGVASPVSDIQGVGGGGDGVGNYGGALQRSVVLINEVAFEVGTGPLNVREAFGEEAVLLHSSGLPVLVDAWGVTLQPLQHGASYYLV